MLIIISHILNKFKLSKYKTRRPVAKLLYLSKSDYRKQLKLLFTLIGTVKKSISNVDVLQQYSQHL